MALDGKSLVGGILILIGIVGTLIGLYVLLPIGGLTVGVITNTATSGAVNVSAAMQTALTGYETSYIADTTAVTNGFFDCVILPNEALLLPRNALRCGSLGKLNSISI